MTGASSQGGSRWAPITGWVTVGQDHDTASFAVSPIGRLLICADGGSNGSRLRLWKAELQRFAAATGVAVTVCHSPPGTSKWDTIEHRLFAHITMNWRGRPLVSHEVSVELIGAITTQGGLQLQAERDTSAYPPKVSVPEAEMAALALTRHTFHGEWNDTIHPQLPPRHV